MGFFANLISLSSFISGTVFGVLVCGGLLLHFLKKSEGTDDTSAEKVRHRSELAMPNPPKSIDALVTPEDAAALKKLINFLEDFNAPLKSIGGYLKQIYIQRDTGIKATKELLERKQKVIIEIGTVSRMEKEFYDNLAHLKEHTKTLKGVTSFLTELSRAFAGFSKDLNRLSNTAKNNMYKGLKDLNIDTKEDMIVNNWWQALHVSLDYMSSDQDYLALQISDELLNFSVQIHDELTVIEKRLNAEGAKQLHNIKEALSMYESKRRERDKYREKVRLQGNSATLTTQSPAEIAQRRALKMKINDDQLALQTSKLYVAQKEFFNLMPRIDADVQLTILKSIVETHSQLLKLTEAFERQQESNKMISKRMKLQLTNAAASLMQMIREEGNLLTPSAASQAAIAAGMGGVQLGASVGSSAISSSGAGNDTSGSVEPEILAYEEALRAKMLESGVQGYELSLQKVLEGLLQHCQAFDFTYGLAQSPQGQLQSQQQASNNSTTSGGSGGSTNNNTNTTTNTTNNTTSNPNNTTTSTTDTESRGELNMTKESTACLAATNPAILPLLPSRFGTAVGTETCVWFNSFSGRVYRDISHSNYFYNWFCAKLTHMLNKGPRPDYVDEFRVNDVQFGVLPPLLMNVQWAPPCKAGPFSFQGGEEERGSSGSSGSPGKKSSSPSGSGRSTSTSSASNSNTTSGGGGKVPVTSPNRAFIYDESDTDGSDSDSNTTTNNAKTRSSSTNTNTNTNTSTTNTNTSTNTTNANTSQSKGRYKAPPPKADDSEFFAACTADMAFRSGIKFTISTKLWINWPRDRYASVPVILYLNLEEISGRIRFGVTRSHSFFSFLGDPLMRINVRNEVGKGAYKFKDFPQLSEFITKKLRAYVHNKIVHPHSHKFRLIWPRNWWPEGTQNEFMGDGEESNKGGSGSNKFPPPPAAPTLQTNEGSGSSSVGSGGAGVGVPNTPHATPVVAHTTTSTTNNTNATTSTTATVPPTPESTPYVQSPYGDSNHTNTTSGNNCTSGTESEQPSGRQRADSLGKMSALAGTNIVQGVQAGVQVLSQVGATASHKVEEFAEKIKSASESAGIASSGSGTSGSGGGNSSGTGASAESGSSSRYSAMRSKVTQWMHNHSSRRASTGNASSSSTTNNTNDDHYHPMSRAAQQAQQQSQSQGNSPFTSSKSTKSKSGSPLPSQRTPQGSQKNQLSPTGNTLNTSSASPSPRRRGSETMQAVMASARQSDLFHPSSPHRNSRANDTSNTAITPTSSSAAKNSSMSVGAGAAAGAAVGAVAGAVAGSYISSSGSSSSSGGVTRLRSPTIYDADGEEGEGIADTEQEDTEPAAEHAQSDHEADQDPDLHLFDPLALQSLTPLQREVLQDNLAWDLEVKNIVNRYLHTTRAQASPHGQKAVVYSPFSHKSNENTSNSGRPAEGTESDNCEAQQQAANISVVAYRAAMRSLAVQPEVRRRSTSNLEGVPYPTHPSHHPNPNIIYGEPGMISIRTSGAGMDPFDQFGRMDSSHSSLTTPHALSPTQTTHTNLNSPETQRRELRSRSILSTGTSASVTEPGEDLFVPRCRSFETSDVKWSYNADANTSTDIHTEMDCGPRPRSYSISDFRPETQDAMFRIHILDNYLHQEALRLGRAGGVGNSDGGSGVGLGQSGVEEESSVKLSLPVSTHHTSTTNSANINANTSANSGTTTAPSAGRTRAHSVTGRPDSLTASTSSRDPHLHPPQRSLPRPQSAYISRSPATATHTSTSTTPTTPSLQQRLSVASGTASAELASKFADFKAKHLNNRDLSQVFMRRPHTDHDQDANNQEQDQEYTQHSLTSMREALDAEQDFHGQDTSSENVGNSRETREGRASISGTGSGGGSSSTSTGGSTLKYMSSMLRSRFGSGESGSDRKQGST